MFVNCSHAHIIFYTQPLYYHRDFKFPFFSLWHFLKPFEVVGDSIGLGISRFLYLKAEKILAKSQVIQLTLIFLIRENNWIDFSTFKNEFSRKLNSKLVKNVINKTTVTLFHKQTKKSIKTDDKMHLFFRTTGLFLILFLTNSFGRS